MPFKMKPLKLTAVVPSGCGSQNATRRPFNTSLTKARPHTKDTTTTKQPPAKLTPTAPTTKHVKPSMRHTHRNIRSRLSNPRSTLGVRKRQTIPKTRIRQPRVARLRQGPAQPAASKSEQRPLVLNLNKAEDVSLENYTLLETIGEGTFGKVKKAVHHISKTFVAIKILEKSKITQVADMYRATREIKILKRLNHRNVLRLLEAIDTPEGEFPFSLVDSFSMF